MSELYTFMILKYLYLCRYGEYFGARLVLHMNWSILCIKAGAYREWGSGLMNEPIPCGVRYFSCISRNTLSPSTSSFKNSILRATPQTWHPSVPTLNCGLYNRKKKKKSV